MKATRANLIPMCWFCFFLLLRIRCPRTLNRFGEYVRREVLFIFNLPRSVDYNWRSFSLEPPLGRGTPCVDNSYCVLLELSPCERLGHLFRVVMGPRHRVRLDNMEISGKREHLYFRGELVAFVRGLGSNNQAPYLTSFIHFEKGMVQGFVNPGVCLFSQINWDRRNHLVQGRRETAGLCVSK